MHFADQITQTIDEKKSHVVVGLDPRPNLMPAKLLEASEKKHGATPRAVADAILKFNRGIMDATGQIAVAVKCQIAFYERYGIEGLKAYSETIRYAREHSILVIGDVKRNDIGSTAEAYAAAHLPGDASGSRWESPDFHVDAVTINPYFGSDGVDPFIERARRDGRGIFVLVKTSNKSSGELQNLDCNGELLYERVGHLVEEWGSDVRGESGYSLVGAVAGATFPEELANLRKTMAHTLFLVPGYGAQGGGAEDVAGAFDRKGHGAIVNSSRGIIHAYRREPYASQYGEKHWEDAARAAAEDMRGKIWAVVHKSQGEW
jgi:orotidine-5'-phosphate decarboxylase